MARGFESKQVEFQQEEAARGPRLNPPMTGAQREARERRRSLELTRARAAADLARASVPAHRRMLQQALEAIDAQLAALEA